jgi:hypothetical protein
MGHAYVFHCLAPCSVGHVMPLIALYASLCRLLYAMASCSPDAADTAATAGAGAALPRALRVGDVATRAAAAAAATHVMKRSEMARWAG